MEEATEKIDWQSFLPAVMPRLREEAAQTLGDEYGQEAEDVVMETVSRFLSYKGKKYLPTFQSEDSALSYLTKMTRNAAIEYLSGLKKKDESLDALESLEDKQAQRSAEDILADREALEALKEVLKPALKASRLTNRERSILSLHLSGYAAAEIAESLGEDVRLIRHELNAIRSKLRYILSKRTKATE